MPPFEFSRRRAVAAAAAFAASSAVGQVTNASNGMHPDSKWYTRAKEMKELAESWGDQSYGAVVVMNDQAIGLGPSRVVKDRDPDAHAERVAIREAQRALGKQALEGAVLYSTSRPCSLCESAAARTGISRMYFGSPLTDAGRPRL